MAKFAPFDAADYLDDEETIAEYLTAALSRRRCECGNALESTQIKACLLYYRRYPREIDTEIRENATLTPEAIQARFGGLVAPA